MTGVEKQALLDAVNYLDELLGGLSDEDLESLAYATDSYDVSQMMSDLHSAICTVARRSDVEDDEEIDISMDTGEGDD